MNHASLSYKLQIHLASIIQHGNYCLEEVKLDVLSLKWNYQGKEVQAIFNQSKENFVLERDSVDLASHCQFKDGQQVILPDGFVVYMID